MPISNDNCNNHINTSRKRKKSFIDETKLLNQNTDESNANSFDIRIDRFINELKSRGQIASIYTSGAMTSRIVKARSMSIHAFYKCFERMHIGKGLLTDPILLSAVLTDCSYPADYIFRENESTYQAQTELLVSEYTIQVIQDAVIKAINHKEKKDKTNDSILKKMSLATTILNQCTLMYEQPSILMFSHQNLIMNIALKNPQYYPIGKSKNMEAISSLCYFYYDYVDKLSELITDYSKLLCMSFLIHEIRMLLLSYQSYGYKKISTESKKNMVFRGIEYEENLDQKQLNFSMDSLLESNYKAVTKYCSKQRWKPNTVTLSNLYSELLTLLTRIIQLEPEGLGESPSKGEIFFKTQILKSFEGTIFYKKRITKELINNFDSIIKLYDNLINPVSRL